MSRSHGPTNTPYDFLMTNGYIERMMDFIKDESEKLDTDVAKALILRFEKITNDKMIFDMFVTEGLLPYYQNGELDADGLKAKEEQMVKENIELILTKLPEGTDLEGAMKQIENTKLPKDAEDRIMKYFSLFCSLYE